DGDETLLREIHECRLPRVAAQAAFLLWRVDSSLADRFAPTRQTLHNLVAPDARERRFEILSVSDMDQPGFRWTAT
ncbi:MAG: hypothetical protein AAGF12_43970, partial [Myxococcota bacterium]